MGIALAVAALTVLQMTRSSRLPVWDVFWAEDGRFFYGDAKTRGFSDTVFEQLGTYLQVVPRLLSNITAAVPVQYAAFTNAFLAALTVSLLAIFVYYTTDGVLGQRWQRLTAAGVLAANPAAGWEVNAAINNLHWFLIAAAFWACLSQTRKPALIGLNAIVILLSALSDPLTGLLLPLVAWRAWRSSKQSARWTLAGLLVGLALQYWLVLAAHRPRHHGGRDVTAIPGVYGLRIAGSFLIGDRGISALWPTGHSSTAWLLPATALLVVAIGLFVTLRYANSVERNLVCVTVVYSVIYYVTVLFTRGSASGYLRHPLSLNGSRYTIVPLILLYSALIVAAGIPQSRRRDVRDRINAHHAGKVSPATVTRRNYWATVLPLATVILIVTQLAFNYAPRGPRTSGVSWRASIASAQAGCTSHLTGTFPGPPPIPWQRPRLTRDIVQVPSPPLSPSYFWAVRLDCSDLR